MKPDLAAMTTRQILGYVARRPRLYPGFAWFLVRHVAAKARFYCLCWSNGYTVREVRRRARMETRPR